jgi:tetratricopeptide (TPR) repeat protein
LAEDAPSNASETPSSGETAVRIGGAPAPPPEARAFPGRIGPYRVIRLLGEGGMGAVYEAEQDQPRRRVALKVIKAAWASQDLLRRFEREFEILGRLHHPGIAQIYEAGTADTGVGSQPYFAMELIEGKTLCRYAEAQRLNTRQRLSLMIQICDAVEHAHQRGVIHRDLKPTNILVDENGQPKILDFGLARVTDSDLEASRQTDIGQLVGTLAYMSPEQVLADPLVLDTRSDVYALGVVLYELLSGRMPYQVTRQLHQAVETIQHVDPAPLSTISRVYRGDIETIVGRALEKDKARRYGSAADLAADLRRHLEDQPITARPPSTAYQLVKFGRRHKAFVAGTAAVFVALVIGVVASTREAILARRERNQAVLERKRADSEAASAKAVVDFLQNDLLAQASARNQSGPGAKPDPDIKVRTALERAVAKIDGKFDQQPEVEAAVRDTMGSTYAEMAQYPEARKQLERALDLERRALGLENPKTLKTQNHLGRTLWHQGQFPEAEALLANGLEIERRVLGPEHPDTLYCMNNLANVYRAEGKDAQAEPLYRRTLDARLRVLGPDHPDTLISINNLANVYWSQGKFEQAASLYAQAMEAQRRVLGPEHPDTLLSMGNLASVLPKEGKLAEAEALFARTLEIARRVLGPEHTNTLAFLQDFALLHQQEAKYALAEAELTEVLEGRRRVMGSEHMDTMLAAGDLAVNDILRGKFQAGEALAREVLAFHKKTQPDDWQRFNAESLLGASLAGQKRYAEAETLLLDGHQGMLARKAQMQVFDYHYLDLARRRIVELYQAWDKPEKAAPWREH